MSASDRASSRDRAAEAYASRSFLRPRNVIRIVILLILLIQIVPVWLWQTNPPALAEPPWDSPSTRQLVQQTCFDCHSNYTVWPWYSKIAPVSWLVTLDVIHGRSHLNFSEWQSGPQASLLLAQAVSAVQSGAMPPHTYSLLNPDANLSAAQKQQLIQGLERSLH